MNINLADPRCEPFYAQLVKANIPLIVHFGEEKAAPGAKQEQLGNPLLACFPLENKVREIAAHAASLGHAMDTDRANPKSLPAFELLMRLMNEKSYAPYLLADLSAIFQRDRTAKVLRAVIEREDLHDRFLHGSDYPPFPLWACYTTCLY